MAWNRSSEDEVTVGFSSKTKASNGFRILVIGSVAVLIVFAVMIATWFTISRDAVSRPHLDKTCRQGIKQSAHVITATNRPEKAEPPKAAIESNVTDRSRMLWRGKKVRSWETNTNMGMVVQTIITLDGKTYRAVREQERIFNNATDQILAMVVGNDHDGGNLPPIPGMGNSRQLEKEFRASLKTPIVINDNDSEAVRELKYRVSEAREGMAAALDSGQSFTDVIDEAKKVKQENLVTRGKALAEYKEILESGNVEAAESYLFKVNLALQQMGIKELPASGNDFEGILRKERK